MNVYAPALLREGGGGFVRAGLLRYVGPVGPAGFRVVLVDRCTEEVAAELLSVGVHAVLLLARLLAKGQDEPQFVIHRISI